MAKLIGIGEAIVDIFPSNNDYTPMAGGAPLNVCACVSKFGANSYYLGKLSTDAFGSFLFENIKNSGVKTEFISFSKKNSPLAFVHLESNGERSFSFYRENTADLELNRNDILSKYFNKSDILHMCSVALSNKLGKGAHRKAIKLCKKAGGNVFFDVNVRLSLYKSEKDCKKTIKQFLKYADVLKVSEDELEFLTDKADIDVAIENLFKKAKNAKLIFLTKGENGATVYNRELKSISEPAFKTNVVDTTGAGDCFIGCVIYKFLENSTEFSLNNKIFPLNKLNEVLKFALAGASVVISRKGAIEAIPTLDEIESVLNR